MSRLRRLAIALLAAATVAVGSLAVPPPASAMSISCAARYQLANSYYALGQAMWALGHEESAYYWWGRSWGIVEGC
jgi:hypothetical protein